MTSCPSCGAPVPEGAEACPSCRPTGSIQATRTVAPLPAGPRSTYTGPKEIAGYRILRELGAGGMGTVFEAFEEKMNRRVALKILSRHLSQSQKASDRFAREAWIGGRLNHPNLIRVFERGETEEVAFYSMELVDGGSLFDVIKSLRLHGRDETWGLEFGTREYVVWAIRQVVAAARGLDYAHRQEVVHRDVKPMNILLSLDPFAVKVADFGLAVDLEATRMTTVGSVLGTAAYMAPEQIQGKQEEIGPATDVFALGVTLFEMLTLELPFSGSTQQLYMSAVLTNEARRPRKLNEKVGRDLEVVIRKALEKNPRDRYPAAGAFADDLENVLQFRPVTAKAPGTGSRLVKWARRKPMHAALAILLVLGLPAVGVLSYRAIQHRRLVARLEMAELRTQARRLLHEERYQKALPVLDEVLAGDPSDVETLSARVLTRYMLARAEPDSTRKGELQGFALADASALIGRLPEAAWPHRLRAVVLKDMGRDSEALPDEWEAFRLRTSSPTILDLTVDGDLAIASGDYPGAEKSYSEIIERQPDAVRARLWRARAYEFMGQSVRALTDHEVAAALAPADPVPQHNLGRLMTLAGDLAGGESHLRKALELDPANACAAEYLVHNLIQQGKAAKERGEAAAAGKYFAEAEEITRRSLQMEPDLPWSHLNLGVVFVEQARLRQPPDRELLVRSLEKAIQAASLSESSGEDPRGEILRKALANQCDVLIELRELQRALEACGRVAALEPDNAVNQYNLAGVHSLLGRREEALLALEKDFELGDRDHEYLAGDPWFEPLRKDPRFVSLLDRMKQASQEAPGR